MFFLSLLALHHLTVIKDEKKNPDWRIASVWPVPITPVLNHPEPQWPESIAAKTLLYFLSVQFINLAKSRTILNLPKIAAL